MSRITWHDVGVKVYETGVDRVVLYPQQAGIYPLGVAWNGVTAVNHSPEGGEATAFYADNVKFLNIKGTVEFKGTIEAIMYPLEFMPCIGVKEVAPGFYAKQQNTQSFGASHRSIIGNEEEGNEFAYKIHLLYGLDAGVSETAFATVNESTEPGTFSWEITSTPVTVPGLSKPSASFELDSREVPEDKLKQIEDILYGTDGVEGAEGTPARLPLPNEIITILNAA